MLANQGGGKMRNGKIAFLAFLILSLALFISGCGPTNQPPNASFSTNTTSSTPLEVNFDASDSSDPDGNIISYDWDSGDGSTGSGETFSHTYDSAGDYTVELTVTDDDGEQDTATSTIEVSESTEPPDPPLPPG